MQSLIYQTFQSGGGSITWDAIEDAVADLTLNNANFSTTFAQTSDVPWTWENTTPATSSGLSTVALVASGTITGASATPTLNTVGADAIVVVIANSNNPPPPGLAFTDSEGNAWTYQTSANFPYLAVAYCLAPTTASSHTFSPTFISAVGVVYAFSGVLQDPSAFDGVVFQSAFTSSPFQIGAITLSAGDLVISAFNTTSSSLTATVDSGFTPTTATSAFGFGAAAASYLIGASGSLNPQWTFNPPSGSVSLNGVNIAFKAKPLTVPQESPALVLAGTYWNPSGGGSSAVDSWTIQDTLQSDLLNPPSILEFSHTGSSGKAGVQVPTLFLAASDNGLSRLGPASIAVGDGTAGDFSGTLKSGTLASSILEDTGSGLTIAASPLTIDQGGNFTVEFLGQFEANVFQMRSASFTGSDQSTLLTAQDGSLLLVAQGGATGHPLVSVNAGIPLFPFSGTQVLFNVGGDPTFANGFEPFSGSTGNFIAAEIQPLIDMQSGSTGASFTALGVYPTLQSVQGSSNLLAAFGTSSAQGTGATLVNLLTIDLSGNLVTSGYLSSPEILMQSASGAPTSAGTAGTAGEIIFFGGVLYFCSVTGGAGSATWNSVNLTAV